MDVVCKECQGNFKISDKKIPKGQVFSINCPQCKNKISIDTRSTEPSSSKEVVPPSDKPDPGPDQSIIDEVTSGTYDASDKPFDFVEEGTETALLCESEPAIRSKIKTALDNMGYHTTDPPSARETLKQMRFHDFDLVVLNERFDTRDPDMNNVLRYLDRLPMATRRLIFVVLVSDRFRTMDNMAAFNKSVNLVVNLKNVDEFEKILSRGVAEHAAFYRVFKESLIKVGRA